MPRAMKIGDKVQAFMNANILGEVIAISKEATKIWTSGGAPAGTVSICSVRIFKTGEVVNIKKSELFIVEY